MKKMFSYARLLSLDVVLGALASAFMVSSWLEVHMPVFFWIVLPISVWVIYTADHLLDAYRLKTNAHTPRHLFHFTYFTPIFIAFLVFGLICVGLVPFFSLKIFYFGLGMGTFTIIHLLLVKWVGDRNSWFYLKELGVGLIYTGGVWGVPILLDTEPLRKVDVLFTVQFFLLAMINLLTFSMYEMKTDKLDGHTSFVLGIGKNNTKKVIGLLAAIILGSSAWTFSSGLLHIGIGVQVIFLLMLAVLLWVAKDEARFGKQEAYRAWADAVFLFPVLIVFFR